MNKTVPIFIGSVAIALGVGGVFGYHYAKNELEAEFDTRLEDEREELRRYYKKRYKADEFETAEKAAERLTTFRGRRSGQDIPDGKPLDEGQPGSEVLERVVQRLKYDAPEPEESWVTAAEAQEQNPEVPSGPRVITVEEFVPNELEYYQPTWRYYSDGILADEDGNVVDDVEGTVGRENLKKFGQGSNEPDLVYVRNTDLERDYEIVREHMKYSDKAASQGETPRKQRHGNRAKA